jgi:hypothetical protein
MVYIVQFLLLTVAIALAMSPVVSSESMTGAIQEADINDKDVQQVVDFVLKFYNDENDDLYASRAVQVMSAKRQVRACPRGLMWVGLPCCIAQSFSQPNTPPWATYLLSIQITLGLP